jgi:hypothetical protein
MAEQPGQYIDKALFLRSRQCLRLGWYMRHQPQNAAWTAGQQFRAQEGRRVGQAARSLFPQGRLISGETPYANAHTRREMADPAVSVLFEATFVAEPFIAKADVLLREAGGWHLLEVKSGFNLHDAWIEDLAYTAFVMRQAGIPPIRTSLLLLSPDYRLGQSIRSLFAAPQDCTEQVQGFWEEYQSLARQMPWFLQQQQPPEAPLTRACRDCPYFATDCHGRGIDHHILHLPRLSDKALGKLQALGCTSIGQIPEDHILTANQRIVRDCVTCGQPRRDTLRIRTLLEGVRWPAGFLDFETVMTALPRLPGVAPHEQIPTQYSLHLCAEPGGITSHREYLASPQRDCRRELAEHLLADCASAQTLVAYSDFEKRIIQGLANQFSDMEQALGQLLTKLFDLRHAFKPDVYYHPDFGGRESIKVVLPAIVPDMSYEGLPIGDGETAVAAFVRMMDGECSLEEVMELRGQLLQYCGQDTLAMVKLHEHLHRSILPA